MVFARDSGPCGFAIAVAPLWGDLRGLHLKSRAEIKSSSTEIYLRLRCWKHSNWCRVLMYRRESLKWYGFIPSTVLFPENGKNHMIASTGLLVLIWWKSLLGANWVLETRSHTTIPSLMYYVLCIMYSSSDYISPMCTRLLTSPVAACFSEPLPIRAV